MTKEEMLKSLEMQKELEGQYLDAQKSYNEDYRNRLLNSMLKTDVPIIEKDEYQKSNMPVVQKLIPYDNILNQQSYRSFGKPYQEIPDQEALRMYMILDKLKKENNMPNDDLSL